MEMRKDAVYDTEVADPMSMLQFNFSLEDMQGELGDYGVMMQCMMGLPSRNGSAGGSKSPLCDDLTHLTDQTQYDVLRQTGYMVTVIILYVIVIFLGAVGNTLVVLTVIKTKAMWNATNIFIANLAVADVFVCILDLPFSVYYQITDDWIFGEALCHVIPMAFAIVVYSSTLTLTLIAIDRYMLILHPLGRRITNTVALIIILAIVVLAIAVALPIAIYAKYQVHEDIQLDIHRRYCMEQWPTIQSRQIYTISTLIIQHFLPLLIIAILYLRIFRRISRRISKQSKNSRRTKTTKMLVAVVGVFAVAWTPFHIHSILLEFNTHPAPPQYYKLIDAVLRVFAMSSSCINPLLYGWLNDNFRNAFLSIIRRPTATPTNIHNEDSVSTRRMHTVVAPSPMRKFYRKITTFGNSSVAGKDNNNTSSCCSSAQVESPEAMPLQTVVVDRNGQGKVVVTTAKVPGVVPGEEIGARVQLQVPNGNQVELSPEAAPKYNHTAQTPLITKKV